MHAFTYILREPSNLRSHDQKSKISTKPQDLTCCFQIGDRTSYKITLSNGDIIFNNFGDVNSTLIFACNNPEVKLYFYAPNCEHDEDPLFVEFNKLLDYFDQNKVSNVAKVDKFFNKMAKNVRACKSSTKHYFV